MITLTENAAKEIRKIMNENELGEEVAVRVGVKGGGCSGLTYTLDFDSRKTKFDLEYESEGMKILVDKKSHLYIKDTEIDWSYSLMDRGLKFQQPVGKIVMRLQNLFHVRCSPTGRGLQTQLDVKLWMHGAR